MTSEEPWFPTREEEVRAVREAAILLLAANAVMMHDCATSGDAFVYAIRHAEAVETDPLWARGRHSGDCTKEAHSCLRCQIEEQEENVWLWLGDESTHRWAKESS